MQEIQKVNNLTSLSHLGASSLVEEGAGVKQSLDASVSCFAQAVFSEQGSFARLSSIFQDVEPKADIATGNLHQADLAAMQKAINFGTVASGVYRFSQNFDAKKQWPMLLRDVLGVSTIVSLSEQDTDQTPGIRYVYMPVYSGLPTQKGPEIISVIAYARIKGSVGYHCQRGVSRTGAVSFALTLMDHFLKSGALVRGQVADAVEDLWKFGSRGYSRNDSSLPNPADLTLGLEFLNVSDSSIVDSLCHRVPLSQNMMTELNKALGVFSKTVAEYIDQGLAAAWYERQ